ncbi:ABC transporter ATP-binding protein [Nocardioides sp. SYSU DS0663]|uniref:ABC transporter ATP-binding protein n=1 Tax=Nocardioides sp. SYSU DS0663 TaxID=3416445 RepID=UPI003F4B3BD6
MLELVDVSVAIGPPGHGTPVLSGIDLTVARGEAVGLVGESGSGKSMTMRTILHTLPTPSQVTGEVRHDGDDVLALSGERLRRFRAGAVSMISQNPQAALNPVLPVRKFLVEGVLAARPEVGAEAALDLARTVLDQVGIADVERTLRSYPHQLSGGMLQRVVIAGSVARGTDLLLADEPTTALDVTTQADVMAILDEARTEAGMAMLFVTHDLDLAAAACDRIAVMSRGRIVESGPAEAVLADPQHEYTQMLVSSKPSLDRRG